MKIISIVDVSLSEVEPFVSIRESFKNVYKKQTKDDSCVDAFKRICYSQINGDEAPENDIKLIMSTYNTTESEVLNDTRYLCSEMGISSVDLDKFIVQIKQDQASDSEKVINDRMEVLNVMKKQTTQTKNGMVISFWLSHFRISECISVDSFKTALETYCKCIIPINGSIEVELDIKKLQNPYEVNYDKDFIYLCQVF